METVAISKINIKIGENEFSLTLEEAKELMKILRETFEPKEIVKEIHVIKEFPITIPCLVYNEYHLHPWERWQITCDSNTSAMSVCLK